MSQWSHQLNETLLAECKNQTKLVISSDWLRLSRKILSLVNKWRKKGFRRFSGGEMALEEMLQKRRRV